MRAVVLAIGVACIAFAARAADRPQYTPVPAWVKPIPIPDRAAGSDQGPLLQVSQARFTEAGDEVYDERAYRIQEPSELTKLGNVVLTWAPDSETLVIHKIEIIRGAQVIDQLDHGNKVQILHREKNLEAAMFDGALTATVQLEGLQVGDIVHLAVTRQVHDQVLKGHSQLWSGLARPGKIGRVYLSASWPASKALHWKTTPGIPTPTVAGKDGGSLLVDATDVEAPLNPRGAPARFGALAYVQMSDFTSWSDVSALMSPLFDKAATLDQDSPLKAEIARIKAQSNDPKTQAAAALALVEDRVRYLFVGLNNGNLIPAKADETWTRRFGDCKAKTALLLSLLHGLGIQAQAALVDTQTGDALPGRLPTLETFDHVAVKATIGGKTYWLDGTRLGDGSLDRLETPNYHWMLPVQASGAQLEELKPTPFAEPHYTARLDLDASAGMDTPAKVHAEHQWRGDLAQGLRLGLQAMSATDRERSMRGYWQQNEPWVTAATVSMKDEGGVLTLVMDGTATLNWGADNRGRTFVVSDSGIGGEVNFQRQPGPNADAPFARSFPSYNHGTIRVTLPNKGQGFMLINGSAIDQVVAGAQYHRTARMDNGAAVIDIDIRAVAPEFSFADASAAAPTLRDWGMHAVMIASNPQLAEAQTRGTACVRATPDEALKACQALLAQPGVDQAAVYFEIGRAYINKGDQAQALEALSKALSIHPDFALALGVRGSILVDKGDLAGAMADLDKAAALSPNDANVLRSRAYAHVARREFDLAVADADKAISIDGHGASVFVARGLARQGLGNLTGAIADYDEALKLDPNLANAHAAKGELLYVQKDFTDAEKEFDRAVALRPAAGIYWMDRGRAKAAQKRFADAVADYDKAIQLAPSNPVIYRNRAAAYTGLGKTELASADIASAARLGPAYPVPSPPRERLPSGAPSQGALASAAPQPGANTAEAVADLMIQAATEMATRDYDSAIKDMTAALKLRPRSPPLLKARAEAQRAAGHYSLAVADYDGLSALDPTNATIMATLGEIQLQDHKWDNAISAFNRALTLNASLGAAYRGRGEAYEAKGDWDHASADYESALKIDPKDLEARRRLAQAKGSAKVAETSIR